jgi:hypothetical protein
MKTNTEPEPYVIYYCERCNRYTDIRYISDKDGGRFKSFCYKCASEILIPCKVEILK